MGAEFDEAACLPALSSNAWHLSRHGGLTHVAVTLCVRSGNIRLLQKLLFANSGTGTSDDS